MSQSYTGLYYPHIHFRDENWLKLSVLYWDKMARIVPRSYSDFEMDEEDSATVRELKDELDFIRSYDPVVEAGSIAFSFLDVLRNHEEEIVRNFKVEGRRNLSQVYLGKMAYDLRSRLLELGLATYSESFELLNMHPKLAAVYMTILAKEMGRSRQYHPVTENRREYIAIAGNDSEQIFQALLGSSKPVISPRNQTDIVNQIANIAVSSVIPKNLSSIPIDTIIRVRKKYANEIKQFQASVHNLVSSNDWLRDIENEDSLRDHLENVYVNNLKRDLDNLKSSLKFFNIETATTALSIQVTLPSLLASDVFRNLTLDPTFSGIGLVSFTGYSLLSNIKKEKKTKCRFIIGCIFNAFRRRTII